MSFRIALISLLLGSAAFAAEDCAGLKASLDLAKSKLADLASLAAELEEKYHKYVTEDFVSQVEGSLDSLSHGSALKVAFARKRLMAAIQEKQATLQTTRETFCAQCHEPARQVFSNIGGESAFCAECPGHASCGTKPTD